MATLDINDIPSSLSQGSQEHFLDSLYWGRLLPLHRDFLGCKLNKDEMSFGRDQATTMVDYSFDGHCPDHKWIKAFSKIHFKLTRETSQGSGIKFTKLRDLSSNGTFVNGERVGKGKSTILRTNDEISIAKPMNRIFLFLDNEDTQKLYPQEVTDRFIITKELGKGAMGTVKLAFKKDDVEQRVAVKIVEKARFSSANQNAVTQAKQIEREIAILKKIEHPCIICVEDVIDQPKVTYMILELVEGGELFDLIVIEKRFQESIGKLHAYQMVSAIQYLHANHITHRDLKPENILVAQKQPKTLIKITDFGLSKFIDETSMMKTFCGTPNYLAPEILITAGSGVYTKAVDMWSLGVIVFICLGGYPPFSKDYKDMDLRDQIIRGRYKFPTKFWKNVSENAKKFISRLLTVDQKTRMTADEAMQDPWLNDEAVKQEAHDLMFPSAAEGTNFSRVIPKKRGISHCATSDDVDMMETEENLPKRTR